MAKGFTFIPNPGLEVALLTSPELGAWLNTLGPAGVRTARRLVHKRRHFLEESIDYAVGLDNRGFILRIFAEDFKAVWHEFGTVHNPGAHYLRGALTTLAPGARFEASA